MNNCFVLKSNGLHYFYLLTKQFSFLNWNATFLLLCGKKLSSFIGYPDIPYSRTKSVSLNSDIQGLNLEIARRWWHGGMAYVNTSTSRGSEGGEWGENDLSFGNRSFRDERKGTGPVRLVLRGRKSRRKWEIVSRRKVPSERGLL